jgi:hypothetical protein
MRAYCAACGAPLPLTAIPGAVNVTGEPARVGAGVATALGWLVLAGGAFFALVVGAFFGFFSASAGLYVGGAIGVISLTVWLALMLGGRKLRAVGDGRALAAQERVIHALAAQRGGALTARQAARALSLREEEADAILTAMAKRPDGRVTLEVDDGGGMTYVFNDVVADPRYARARVAVPRQVRVIDAELLEDEAPVGAAARRATR